MAEGETGAEDVVHFIEGLKDGFYLESLVEIDQLITQYFDEEGGAQSDN